MRAKVDEIIATSAGYVDTIMAGEWSAAEQAKIVAETEATYKDFFNPGMLAFKTSVAGAPVLEWEARDAYIANIDGTKYLDCVGGCGVFSCGHNNQEILDVVKAQLDRYALHGLSMLDPLRGFLAKLMAMVTPGDLQYSFFCNGGAEAVEMALKLARLSTGKNYYISTINGFHGKSFGGISVSGKEKFRKPFLPGVQAVQHVKFGDADALETVIENLLAVGETVAAFIVEPIQGEGGVNVPPANYLTRVRQICDKYDVLMIADEIQTGFGRTGTWWGVDHEGVVPDIIVFGKGVSGGILPITGITAKAKLWDKVIENPWVLGSPTFGGNPAVCAAGIATIKYMAQNDIPKQFKEKGEYFLEKLKALQKKHKVIVDVRGKGLLIGLEYESEEVGFAVSQELFNRKILVCGTLNKGTVYRIEPPAIITYEEIDYVLKNLDEALTKIESK